ncbi:hypothetical protein PDIDSM_2093 [Penicillium digitatum]|nr:hypothetical protein PDIDSM_2093 [Penicillium digitatum]
MFFPQTNPQISSHNNRTIAKPATTNGYIIRQSSCPNQWDLYFSILVRPIAVTSKRAAGELSLPPYEQMTSGEIIVRYGEVFCRIPGCDYGRVPLSNTRALRTHLRTHGVMVARNTSGRISQGGQDAAVAWFEALFPENEPHDGD